MRNNSKPFRGIKLSPSTIKVTDSKRPSLLEGQQVVVFKPTDIAIATDTGRKIGNKERILGVGRVVIDGKDTLEVTKELNLEFNKKDRIKLKKQIKLFRWNDKK